MKDPFDDVPFGQRRAVLITAIVIALAAILGFARPTVLGTIAVISAFFLMIMLHELGHFVTAKRAGMKVTEFFVGFGPRLWSFTRGETEYGVKVFPLGGYCKIVGMTNLDVVDPADEPRAYRAKGWGAKVLVASAGSAMHFLIALVLMWSVLAFAGDFRHAEATSTVNYVDPDGPAHDAGIRAGDTIIAVGGHAVDTWDEVVRRIIPSPGEPVEFVVQRDGRVITTDVVPARHEDDPTRGYAGVGDPHFIVPRVSVAGAVVKAPGEITAIAGESVRALGKVFSFDGIRNYFQTIAGEAPEEREDERFLSPVGFGRLANQAVAAGWVSTFGLLLVINVFVGLFNLVPLLPFDGGHIAIATYERIASGIRRRRVQVDVAKLMPLTAAVIAILGFIFLSSVFLDVSNPVQNPF
jgi:membrane-associated protease RseP (regulator of RpoE activity)